MTVVKETDHLGKYRLDGVIGKGTMGVVFKGFDEDIERPVAVKVLHSHLLGDDMGDELAMRFRLEAKAAAHCMHSRIVSRGQREAASRGDFSNYLADKISNEKERIDFLQKLSEVLGSY